MCNKTDNNIYFLTLEFGVKNISTGISFSQTIQYLQSKSVSIDPNFKPYFRLWFYENFYINGIYETYKSTNTIERKAGLNNEYLAAQDDKLAIITGEAHQTYSDFMELKFAYKSSKSATIIAIISVLITLLVGVAQIYLTLRQQNLNNATPNVKETNNGCKKQP